MNAVEKYVTVFVSLLREDRSAAAVTKRTVIGDVAPVLAWLLPDTEVRRTRAAECRCVSVDNRVVGV